MLIWLLILVPLALGVLARRHVRETFLRYHAIADRNGLTGAQVAGILLDAHGLDTVPIEPSRGALSDHYDPQTRTLHLSAQVAGRPSVAAIGIAAHEVAHAYQDAEGSRAYRRRVRVGEPLAKVAPYSGIILVGGLWFGSRPLIVLACAYMAALVVFSIVTLPVELEASRRAVDLLSRTGLAYPDELTEILEVLRAAAFTYIAGIAMQLGIFLAVLLSAAALFVVNPL